jgi:hypothetical protein
MTAVQSKRVFENDVPQELVFSFDQPRECFSKFRDQTTGQPRKEYIYSCVDGPALYADEKLHKAIQDQGIQKGERILITKRQKFSQQSGFYYNIWEIARIEATAPVQAPPAAPAPRAPHAAPQNATSAVPRNGNNGQRPAATQAAVLPAAHRPPAPAPVAVAEPPQYAGEVYQDQPVREPQYVPVAEVEAPAEYADPAEYATPFDAELGGMRKMIEQNMDWALESALQRATQFVTSARDQGFTQFHVTPEIVQHVASSLFIEINKRLVVPPVRKPDGFGG